MIVNSALHDDQKAALGRLFKVHLLISTGFILLMLAWVLIWVVANGVNGFVMAIVFLCMLAARIVASNSVEIRADRITGSDRRRGRWICNSIQFSLIAFLFGIVLIAKLW